MTDQSAFEVETANHKDDSTLYETITSSFELLDISVDDATNKKKTLASASDLVISLMREVELREKAAEEAKQEAATSGLDVLAKLEALKHAQQRAKRTNDMHARELYAEKAVLAKSLKELQLRVSGVLNEGDRCLGVFDEMRIELEMRLTSAIREKELADKEKLEKERLAQEALAFEESRMLKLVEESKRLKHEAVKISTLQDFLEEHEFDVDILHGDVSDKCHDINLFRECLDQPVLQLSGLLSSSQTSILPSSSSSLTSSLVPGHELHLKTVASNGDEPVQFVNEFVIPENELLLKIPDLALEKQEGNMNESSVVKNAPVVADIPEVGHSVASAQTYAEPVFAPLTVKHDVKIGRFIERIRKKKAL